MNKNVFFAGVLWILTISNAYSQYWIEQAGGSLIDEANDISMDASGNTYTTGYYSFFSRFGTYTITPVGVSDVFVAKTNPSGNFVWVQSAGGPGTDRGLSVKSDASGNVYVTGFFTGTAAFGPVTLTSSSGTQDIFIAKYNTSGNLIWAKKAGGSGMDMGYGINVDNNGNVLVTGQFSGTAFFENTALTSMINPVTGTSSADVFVAKYDPSGNLLWVKSGTAKFNDRGYDIAADQNGNVYAVGQFSDTVTFDVTHTNNMYNAIFLIKFDKDGNEKWFRKAGGGMQNIAYAIALDKTGQPIITGDFLGNMIFFGNGNTVVKTLSGKYANRIFIAKYDDSGSLLWANSNSSDSEVSSRNLALDKNSNIYIVGNFRCTFTDFSDAYGKGTFNSVGYKDIFVTKYNSDNSWAWSRNCGGPKEDFGSGIAVDASGEVYICGSFLDKISFATGSNFPGNDPPEINSDNSGLNYCADANYGKFRQLNTFGHSDAFIAKAFDPTRSPYDYYYRILSGNCSKPYVGVCLFRCGMDTVQNCDGLSLMPNSNASSNSVGPYFTYQWNTGDTFPGIFATTTGLYIVTQTSEDGCYKSTDSVYAKIPKSPSAPTITDSKGYNKNTPIPKKVYVFYPDTNIVLTGGNFGRNSHFWSGQGIVPLTDSSIRVNQTDTYIFTVRDSNGCFSYNQVPVIFFKPNIAPPNGGKGDTIIVCGKKEVRFALLNEYTNYPIETCCNPKPIWKIGPGIDFDTLSCTSVQEFLVDKPGTYTISVGFKPDCVFDSLITVRFKFTVIVYPETKANIKIKSNKSLMLCPGDSIQLSSTGARTYTWTGNVTPVFGDSVVKIFEPGFYSVSTQDTNKYGCPVTGSDTIEIIPKPQPMVTAAPSLICPNDSVLMTVNIAGGSYTWIGPTGPEPRNSQSIYVSAPGYYFCIVRDSSGCELISNTIEVRQYATPFLIATGGTMLCTGGSLPIQAVGNNLSTFQWLPPLSGSNPIQTVNAPGTYVCRITSCGIVSMASITISLSVPDATIFVKGSLTTCEGDSVILYTSGNMADYIWQPGGIHVSNLVVYTAGTYSLTVIDPNGCTSNSVPVTVTFVPNTAVTPLVSDTFVCAGQQVKITARNTGNTFWFSGFYDSIPFSAGKDYTTPVLTHSVKYFIQNIDSVCKSPRVPVNITVFENPVLATVPSQVCAGEPVRLEVTNPTAGAHYSWYGPMAFSSTGSSITFPAILGKNGTYYLTASDSNGCMLSDSVEIKIRNCAGIIPNIFTPNGDGVNDEFRFYIDGIENFRAEIYDRWGLLIYYWSDPSKGWNGITNNGKFAPEGTYYYIIYGNIPGAEMYSTHGYLQLLR